MSLTFPDWYQGGYPTVDKVLINLLQPYLNQVGPVVPTATWQLPQAYSTAGPQVWCFRKPGVIDMTTLMDHAVGYVGVIAETPDDDWYLDEFCGQMLIACRDGVTVTMDPDQWHPDPWDVFIDHVEEMEGPEQVEELNPLLRLTPRMWHLTLRMPRTVPDYRVLLGIR